MREIKFRGRATSDVTAEDGLASIKAGDWLYGYLIIDKHEAYIVNGVVEANWEYIALDEWCPVDIKTVGQYTDLKDKNGVEIYEGDIVRRGDYDNYQVCYGEFNENSKNTAPSDNYGWFMKGIGTFGNSGILNENICQLHSIDGVAALFPRHVVENQDSAIEANGFDVIGNIYENPDLLKALEEV